MKCIFYYFEDEFPLKLCPAHRSTQCKGKVGCRGLCLWASQAALVVKNLPANAGDMGSIFGLRRSPEVGNGNPLQKSCLGNPMDKGAW